VLSAAKSALAYQRLNLYAGEATVPAGRADGGEVSRLGPSDDGPGVDSEKPRDLGGRQGVGEVDAIDHESFCHESSVLD
jgi:hypothetical protein